MNPENSREEQLFRDALARPAGPERKGFLDGACAKDPALRQRLEVLLQAHENPATALEDMPPSPGATIKLSFPEEEAPGTVIGRYKLLQKIGEGGSAGLKAKNMGPFPTCFFQRGRNRCSRRLWPSRILFSVISKNNTHAVSSCIPNG